MIYSIAVQFSSTAVSTSSVLGNLSEVSVSPYLVRRSEAKASSSGKRWLSSPGRLHVTAGFGLNESALPLVPQVI